MHNPMNIHELMNIYIFKISHIVSMNVHGLMNIIHGRMFTNGHIVLMNIHDRSFNAGHQRGRPLATRTVRPRQQRLQHVHDGVSRDWNERPRGRPVESSTSQFWLVENENHRNRADPGGWADESERSDDLLICCSVELIPLSPVNLVQCSLLSFLTNETRVLMKW